MSLNLLVMADSLTPRFHAPMDSQEDAAELGANSLEIRNQKIDLTNFECMIWHLTQGKAMQRVDIYICAILRETIRL